MSRLELALQQLTEQLAGEHQRQLRLVLRGVEAIPDDWFNALFDVSSQLLRNAVEHGIEPPEQRVARGKPTIGTLEIGFVPMNGRYEYSFRDDGEGLDVDRILDAGEACGFVGKGTEARDAGRGNGMQIVREQIRRLGGKIQIATKRGRFTCVRADLPALPAPAVVGKNPHA
jgi:chemotaxis protein histidine kinase CheA